MSDLFKSYDEFLPDPTPSRCPADGITVSIRRRKNSKSRGRPAVVFTIGPEIVTTWLGKPKLEASIKILWASGSAKGRVALVAMPIHVVGWRLKPSALGATSSIYVANYPQDANHEVLRSHDTCLFLDVIRDDPTRPALIIELPPSFYLPPQLLIDLAPAALKSLPAPEPEKPTPQQRAARITSRAEGIRALANFAAKKMDD